MCKLTTIATAALFVAMTSSQLLAQEISPEQATFTQAITAAREAYDAAKNDLAKGGVRPKRANAICSSVSSTKVTDWVGSVYKLTTNGDGWGVLSIELEGDIWLSTWNNSFSDAFHKTLIDPSSKLFEQLSSLEEEQAVVFSGSFIKDDNAADCFREQSMTMAGAMLQPEFVFVFSEVVPAP